MKELHFYSYDSIWNPWLGGGGGVRDLEILKQYLPHFSKVTLFIGAYPKAKDTLWEGIHIKHLGPTQTRNEWTSRFHYIREANKQIKKSNPSLLGFALCPYTPLFGFYNTSPHFGILHHYIGKHWLKKWPVVGAFVYLFEKWYYKKAKNIVLLNQDTLQYLQSFRKSGNYYSSYNSFDNSLLNLSDEQDPTHPYILYFGRLDPYMKGIDTLVEAFSNLSQNSQESKRWKLLLAGRANTSSTKALKELLSKHPKASIEVVYNPSDTKKKQLLSKCSFFCSPSRFEGWGIAALEANATGKPCLVSNAAGFQSSIGDNISGERVLIQSSKDLEKALKRWIENPEYVDKLRLGAKEWAKQFSWEHIAQKEWEWIQKSILNTFPSRFQ